MVCHEDQSSHPVVDGETRVSKPGVSVGSATAPLGLGDVVVQMNVDFLLGTLCRNGIKKLVRLVFDAKNRYYHLPQALC